MDSEGIVDYLLRRDVPERFAWPEYRDDSSPLETVELIGTLQAGNEEEIYLLSGGVVLRLPTEAVLGIADATVGPQGGTRLVVNTSAVAEARTRLLLLPELRDDIPPLVLKGRETIVQNIVYTDKTLNRFKGIVKKLRKLKLPVPIGTDGGTATYSYLSSAISTPSPDGGSASDSDPIRVVDD
jgi:hypothetical protein